ncbi:type IV pilus biogenesis protein PilP, partial [Escherichia coli]|nr:type IV pilus biogenesis protein PilP [Escherichia coli]
IQDETALYEAMLTREKIRHELRMLEQGIPAEPGRPQESTSAIPTAPSTAASPRLTEIFGVQPQLSARIELPGGHITDVKAGQNIPGTPYLVEKITPESVVLEQSGIRKTLRP